MLPSLSVIVPIYNVRAYLQECLDSLVNQSLNDLEVIMVDDGSTDGSGDIAKKYAALHDGFAYHRKKNGGLGQARNYGVKYAHGEYIAFLDSDDVVPKSAYRDMYVLGKEYDCDLVTGGVERFNSSGTSASGLHKKALLGAPRLTHITKTPSLFYDTTSTNKLFRRSFWIEKGFTFPEGVLYEDIPVAIPAHYKANKVAVLDATVYLWRTREGASSSITQRRLEEKNFKDRMTAIRSLDNFFIENNASCEQRLNKDKKTLDLDFLLYINKLDEADEAFRSYVVSEIAQYLNDVMPDALNQQRAINRIKYYYIQHEDIEGLLSVIRFQRRGEKTLSVWGNAEKGFYGRFPFKDAPRQLMSMTYEYAARGPWTRVDEMFIDDERIRIDGQVSLAQACVARRDESSIEVALVSRDDNSCACVGNACIQKAKSAAHQIRVSRDYRRVFIRNIKYGAFRASFSLSDVAALEDGVYCFEARYTYRGLVCAPVRLKVVQKAGHHVVRASNGKVVALVVGDYGDLRIAVWTPMKAFVGISDTNSDILRFETSGGRTNERFGSCSMENWAYFGINERQYVLREGRLVALFPDSWGKLAKGYLPKAAVSSSEQCDDGGIVSFSVALPKEAAGNLLDSRVFAVGQRFGRRIELKVSEDPSGSCAVAELDLRGPEVLSRARSDEYHFKLMCANGCSRPIVSASFVGEVGRLDIGRYRYKVSVEDFELILTIKALSIPLLGSKVKRKVVEETVYRLFRCLPLWKKAIVFESSWGDKTDCNPGALYDYIQEQHPDMRCYWLLNDRRIGLRGAGSIVQKRYSLSYYYVLARARFFVNNANFPDEFIKRPHQVEVQTMHGTPLKTLGLDVPGELSTDRKRKAFLRRCSRWDYLIVQGPAGEEITKSCYAYTRQYLRTGYPRNDMLHNAMHDGKRSDRKKALGLDPEKQFVLYAPTWRTRNHFDLKLDFDELISSCGDKFEYGIRVHQFAAKGFDPMGLNDRVHNFSNGVTMEDLLLVADVVITDYSSLMFDCSAMNLPMLFFVYDLEDYRDNLRGFNLDFVAEAPAPLLRSTAEVKDALDNMERITEEYKERYSAFRNKYCRYERGNAAEAVYSQVVKPVVI